MSRATVLEFTHIRGIGGATEIARVAVVGKMAYTYLRHDDGAPSLLFTGTVGKKMPTTWAEWNVLPTSRLTHEGLSADRRWAEIVS